VLIAGGFEDLGLVAGQVVEEFDPATSMFAVPFNGSQDATLSIARGGHAMAPVPGGRAVMAGGLGPDGLLGSAEVYTSEPNE
jgi:hypothetical protein